MKSLTNLFAVILAGCVTVALAATDPIEQSIEKSVDVNEEMRKTQKKIDELSEETKSMLQSYRNTLQQIESLKAYNSQLNKLIDNQKETKLSVLRQIDSIEETRQNIVPLMLRMIEVMEQFLELDMPFLVEERQSRLSSIKKMMDRPDVSLPDKYRRIMEMYTIEMDYGRNVGTEKQTIEMEERTFTAQTLRIGRVALLFQTLDGEQSGFWNKDSRKWEALPDHYNKSIAEGIQIANQQSPPALFKIPVQLGGSEE